MLRIIYKEWVDLNLFSKKQNSTGKQHLQQQKDEGSTLQMPHLCIVSSYVCRRDEAVSEKGLRQSIYFLYKSGITIHRKLKQIIFHLDYREED